MLAIIVCFTIVYFLPGSSDSALVDVEEPDISTLKKDALVNLNNPKDLENDFNDIQSQDQVLEEPEDSQVENNEVLKDVLVRPNTAVKFPGKYKERHCTFVTV